MTATFCANLLYKEKENLEMLRRLILRLFSNKSSFVILVGMNLLGCAGSTTVQRQHHLLLEDSSKASVCFLRPKQGFMGVSGKPIGINLDGENLLDLSVGQYTFLDLKAGQYDMVVTSWTVEAPDNAMAETSRYFVLDLAEGDSVYLLFTLEESNFWNRFKQSIAQQILNEPSELQIGEHVTLQLSSEHKPQPGIGYKVKSVSRKTAIEAASELEPVEGAQISPLRK